MSQAQSSGNQVAGKPPNGRKQRSLKNLWINPQYQTRYIFWISLSGLLLVICNSTIFYFFTSENYALLVDLSPMTDEAKMQLYKELKQIITLLITGNLAFLVLISIVGLIFSHRAAGPLYHFKRVFRDIKNGNLAARIRLRPHDDFKEVAAEFNEMIEILDEKLGRPRNPPLA